MDGTNYSENMRSPQGSQEENGLSFKLNISF